MNNTPTSMPPLTWLRAFETAGRLLSFKAAASELSVSPSTISHQVRDLENLLGFPLFVRSSRSISLTDEGLAYLQPLKRGFELIHSVTQLHCCIGSQLRIGALPFFANEVLMPNVQSLKTILPDTRILLYSSAKLEQLTSAKGDDRMDVVLRYGPRQMQDKTVFHGFLSHKLFDISLVPIQSSRLAPITSLPELLAQPVVRVLNPFDVWETWATSLSMEDRPQNFVLETDSYHAAALAVERGEGICLGMLPYMKPWFEQRRVQMVEQFSCPTDQALYLVYAPHNESNADISALADWLTALVA